MARIIGGTTTTGISLTNSADNPVTVTGTISVASGVALSGTVSVNWLIYNQGLISANQIASGKGVYLAGFGTVDNTGTITAGGAAVEIVYGGAFSNASTGTIGGYFFGVELSENLTTKTVAGTVTNAGTIGFGPGSYSREGVVLGFGGNVTNLAGAAIKADKIGVYLENADGSVVNAGSITATKTFGVGVVLTGTTGGSDYLSNASTGIIDAGKYGVRVGAGAGFIVNYGQITGTTGYGVNANNGGTINNLAGATITGGGANGVRIWNGPRYVNNYGLISSTESVSSFFYAANRYGVNLTTGTVGPAYVYNGVGGTIIGVSGVGIGGAPGSVFNAGTIEATAPGGDAVLFWKGQNDKVIIDPGAVFIGTVNGGNTVGATAISTLVLASTAAAIGTLSGIGSQYINFAQITVVPGASWQFTGYNSISIGATLTNTGTLKLLASSLIDNGGLVNNGTINIDPSTLTVAGIYGAGSFDLGANSTMTINGTVVSGETIVFTGTNAVLNILDPSGFAGTIQGQGPTDTVNGLCFVAGTRIATQRGEVPVEDLAIGELVHAQFAGVAAIKWLGSRRVDCRRHPRPQEVWPVRVRRGAFGDGLPRRDLWLSPDHAMFVCDVLIPVKYLINGISIEQVELDEVIYHHVELPAHDVLLAEGLPAESYLDTGGRFNLVGADGPITLHPDFSTGGWDNASVWEGLGCAPLVVAGDQLTAARLLVDSHAVAVAKAARTRRRASRP